MSRFLFRAIDLSPEESLEIDRFKSSSTREGLVKLGDDAGLAQVWRFPNGNLIFKEYSINKIKQRFRSNYKIPCSKYGHRYGWSERINAGKMKGLYLPAPDLRFYYEKGSAFLCNKQVVVFEYLDGYMTLDEQVEKATDWKCLLELVESFVFEIATAGVFHMDLNSKNIMISGEQLRLIDFEFVCWERTEIGSLYSYYFGYLFQKWLHQYINAKEYENWFISKLEFRMGSVIKSRSEMMDFFELGINKELSRSERFKLFI